MLQLRPALRVLQHLSRNIIKLRPGASAAPYATLTPVAGGLAFESSYDQGLVAEFKRRIPHGARRWDGTNKRWLVDPRYAGECAQLVRTFLGVTLTVPQQAAMTITETRLIKLEYLGACKSRGAGDSSAYGWADGGWTILIQEIALQEWFEAIPQQPGEKPTFYAVLTVKPTATPDEIKKAFRRLARQWHPDTSREPGATEQFKVIKAAYDVLGDPLRRKKYDAGRVLEASIHELGQIRGRTIQQALGRGTYYDGEVTYRPPLRCGWILAEGHEKLGRFSVEKILGWEDVVQPDGKMMVTSWPTGAQQFVTEWI